MVNFGGQSMSPVLKTRKESSRRGARLEDREGRSHGRLDDQGLDVLPRLLEQTDQEIDREGDVLHQLGGAHAGVADSHAEAEDLLELELDVGTDLVHLVVHGVSRGEERRELTGLVETGAQQTRDLLDERLG